MKFLTLDLVKDKIIGYYQQNVLFLTVYFIKKIIFCHNNPGFQKHFFTITILQLPKHLSDSNTHIFQTFLGIGCLFSLPAF